jgi:hypothetical protein
MDELSRAIEENTIATLEQTSAEIRKQIEYGETAEGIIKDTDWTSIDGKTYGYYGV